MMLASCAFCTSSVIERLAVDAGERGLLLLAVDNVGDLREVHRRASLLRDDDAAELRRFLDLAFDTHDRVLRAVRDAPRGHILVGVANGGDDLIDADAECGQRVGLDLHQDLPGDAAVDVDAGDAREHSRGP